MAKDKIYIQDNNEITELTGKEKDDFIAERKTDELESKARFNELDSQKALKVSAYKKLGLTEEEINAIL